MGKMKVHTKGKDFNITLNFLYRVFTLPKTLIRAIKIISAYSYPCLLLHGGGDLIVAPKASRWLFENITSIDKQLKIYDDLYHEIYNEQEKDIVIEDVHKWVEKRI